MAADIKVDAKSPAPPHALIMREAKVAREAWNTLQIPCDPHFDDTKWYDTGLRDHLGPRTVHSGNHVKYLIGGHDTFASMVKAILTAGGKDHFIYLLGWDMYDDFGLPGGATLHDFFQSASNKGVQIRVMLWDSTAQGKWARQASLGLWKTQNTQMVGHVNDLDHGAAILDKRHLNFGSHHQKVLIVNGSQGLIAFCGGVDINPNRVNAVKDGDPQHDVHCRIQGPAALDLLCLFTARWLDHPDHAELDQDKGSLIGEHTPSSVPSPGRQHVQIGRTFGNGTAHGGLGGGRPYDFAPAGENTAWQMIKHAIGKARRFIYLEDQYLVSMAASQALQAALGNIEHLIILIPYDAFLGGQTHYRRREFIRPLKAAAPGKVHVFHRFDPDQENPDDAGYATYCHSKTWVFDDEFAIIGSANSNRRGYTHDSEVIAGICDAPESGCCDASFAHRLRMSLWSHHLGLPLEEVFDGVASVAHWIYRSPNARVISYDETADIETYAWLDARTPSPDWDNFIDPDGSAGAHGGASGSWTPNEGAEAKTAAGATAKDQGQAPDASAVPQAPGVGAGGWQGGGGRSGGGGASGSW